MNRRQFVGAASVTVVAAAAGFPRLSTRAQSTYSSVDLGVPEGFDSVVPVALNNNGVAVVTAFAGEDQAVFIVEEGVFTRLGGKSEVVAHATCIGPDNNVGGWVEAVSQGSTPARDEPILLTPTDQVEMPGKQIEGRVFALQQGGAAVGEGVIDAKNPKRKAVIWVDQDVSELKGVPADGASAARDINGLGQIAGWMEKNSGAGGGRTAAVLSRDADPVEITGLGGTQSEAVAISEQGLVVGNSTTSDATAELGGNGTAAFSWIDGTTTALQTVEGQAWSLAADVNSYALVAGTIGWSAPATAGPATTAVVWAVDSVLDLNQSATPVEGITLTTAVSINELGQVLCGGVDAAGKSHAVLLTMMGN